ncbi:MAG: CoA pyrophosphatase [Candidatus Bathyarchaeota archaeon]|nr:CoA pyrophosphatase [Candidatus Bathyarchaeota archaeon]MDP7443385.1 CoA pyrophosphatase [Candidatus Bathyarchaeota archaeon]
MLNHITMIIRNRHTKQDDSAHAAVTMLFIETGGTLKVLLVMRAIRTGYPWSGNMAFPGGRRDHGDPDLMATAYRETQEETGIDLTHCKTIGPLDGLHSTVIPDLCIQPFMFFCKDPPEMVLNEELIAHYWIPLEELDVSRGKTRVGPREVPAYLLKGKVIWGLTYRMLEKVFDILNGET